MTDKEIDKPCYSACNNRPRVRSTAMQANKNNNTNNNNNNNS